MLPRSVSALIGTNPRVIADEVWAKLLWAGLNLTSADLPGHGAATSYPIELFRVVTLTWLFSGLRSDEITRLRLGCIRWQHNGAPIPGDSRDVLAVDAVCLLDVPVHKTGTAFTKPVDPLLGQAIQTWQTLRPAQPTTLDRKTGEHVELLFCLRGQPVSKTYINRTIIPVLAPAPKRCPATAKAARTAGALLACLVGGSWSPGNGPARPWPTTGLTGWPSSSRPWRRSGSRNRCRTRLGSSGASSPGDPNVPPRAHLLMHAIAQRIAWRAEYDRALSAANGPPPCTANVSAVPQAA